MVQKSATVNTQTQLLVSTSTQTFTVDGQKYRISRYPERIGPSFEQELAIAEKTNMKMLTVDEAWKIVHNDESNAAFRNALKPGEWTNVVRDLKKQDEPPALLVHDRSSGLDLYDHYSLANLPARVLILKEPGSKAAVPKEKAKQHSRAEQIKELIEQKKNDE